MAKKVKNKKQIALGRGYIKSTFNNTIVTITDDKGDVVSWWSTGAAGFKGAKKGTPYAAQIAGEVAAKKAVEVAGMLEVEVYVKGPGAGRETAIRAIQNAGIKIRSIKDVTPIPHNGCRPKKRRRV